MTSPAIIGEASETRVYLTASTAAAILSALIVSVLGSIYDGVPWNELVGILYYALIFVFPFTLVGSFAVVWPVHRLLGPIISSRLRSFVVLIVSSAAGAAMLGLFAENRLAAAIGALSGLCTAAVWLTAYHIADKARHTA